jgi:YHS domain-containing protein
MEFKLRSKQAHVPEHNVHNAGEIFPGVSRTAFFVESKPEHCEKLGETPENGTVFAQQEPYARSTLEGEAMNIDPVCGMIIDDNNREFQTMYAGRKFFFCSEECRKEFEERPEEYVEPAAA